VGTGGSFVLRTTGTGLVPVKRSVLGPDRRFRAVLGGGRTPDSARSRTPQDASGRFG
jgi:hypothetical protein